MEDGIQGGVMKKRGRAAITAPKADSQNKSGPSQLFPMFVILRIEMDGFG